jgi:hypothetical protein
MLPKMQDMVKINSIKDGKVTESMISREVSDAMEQDFLQNFDPKTGHRRLPPDFWKGWGPKSRKKPAK